MLPEYGSKEFEEYIEELTKEQKPKRHKFYDKSVEEADEMAIHTQGKEPKEILERKRPNEDPMVREYRLESWEPVTLSLSEKVISVINRIYNPRLYNISFHQDVSKKIDDEYKLENYLIDLPIYGSLMKFITDVYTPHSLTDPNSVIFIEPVTYNIKDDTEYYEPIPKIYSSKCLWDFKEWEYYVIEHNEDEFCIVDTMVIRYFRKQKSKEKVQWVEYSNFEHNFGFTPCFRIGGMVKKADDPLLYKSFISGVKPHWNKAIGMISDLDGQTTNHVYLEKWEYAATDCGVCNGRGYTLEDIENHPLEDGSKKQAEIKCTKCYGTGKVVNKSPFDVTQLNPDPLNSENRLPTPPAGYIDKNVDPLRFLSERTEKELNAGLFAINMDVILKVGENQSGIAKAIDRQDLDSFFQKIANHTFKRVIPMIITSTAYWLYKKVLNGDQKQIEKTLPSIEPPVSFDILSITSLIEELKGIKEAGLSPSIINGTQMDFIEKRFNSEKEKKRFKAILKLDPLSSLSSDEILSGTSNGTVKREEQYLHYHMAHMIDEAIAKNKDFLDKDFEEQMKILLKMSEEKLKLSEMLPVANDGSDITGDERPDIEAEAKARLKGSVGGTQGILQIQKSVSEGVTQYSAAVALLIEIYGFDEKQAKNILGNPSKMNSVTNES